MDVKFRRYLQTVGEKNLILVVEENKIPLEISSKILTNSIFIIVPKLNFKCNIWCFTLWQYSRDFKNYTVLCNSVDMTYKIPLK